MKRYTMDSELQKVGRFTELAKDPTVIIDGAHNEGAAMALESSIRQYFGDKKVILVIGVFKDKEYDKLLSHLVPLSKQVITVETPNNDRAMPARELAEKPVLILSMSRHRIAFIREIKRMNTLVRMM